MASFSNVTGMPQWWLTRSRMGKLSQPTRLMTVVSIPEGMSIPPGEPSPTRATALGSNPALADGLMHGLAHASGSVFGAVLDFGGNAQPGEHPPQVIDHANLDVRSSQVNPHEKRWLASWIEMNSRVSAIVH